MRRITLEYQSRHDRSSAAGWILLIAGAAFCAEVLWSYASLKLELKDKQEEIAAISRETTRDGQPRRTLDQKDILRRTVFASNTINRLAMPWNALLAGLEDAHSDDVSLLAVEPDAQAGSILLGGGDDRLLIAVGLYHAPGNEQDVRRHRAYSP